MNFEFSEQQKELQSQAARFLAEKCPPAEVHRILNGKETHSSGLWKELIDQGWTATAMPESCGGFGMGYLELCILARELGRVCAPVPFASSVYLAGEAIRAAGTAQQQQKLLCAIGSGSLVGTLASFESASVEAAGENHCRVENGRLYGVKTAVPDGQAADFAVVSARQGTQKSLFLAYLDAPSVSRAVLNGMDNSRSLSKIEFDGVDAEPLGPAGSAEYALETTWQRAAVLLAFEQLGGAEGALEMARKHAIERKAFGRAIGSFQAIKHRLAEMYVSSEIARSNCYHGAYSLSTDDVDLPVASAAAYLSASKAFTQCAQENIQIHGGAGFTWSGDCQLFYRRALWLQLLMGGQRRWKQRLVRNLINATPSERPSLEVAGGL